MYRILVADDEPIERQVVHKKIMNFFPGQVEVFLAENGIEAVKVFRENDCQVALLDIAMPGMTGLDAAEEIRKISPECGIIFLTAFDDFGYAKKAIRVRALDYLLKPGADEDIINALERAFYLSDKRANPDSEESKEPAGYSDAADSGDMDIRDEEASNTIVRDISDYISGHYKEDISLQDVASVLGYSDVYFCKIFKQNFGRNFITYLNNYRIERAKQLLADPDINIKDVSTEAGYRDANYFTRVFKRIVGTTPSEYRLGALGQ